MPSPTNQKGARSPFYSWAVTVYHDDKCVDPRMLFAHDEDEAIGIYTDLFMPFLMQRMGIGPGQPVDFTMTANHVVGRYTTHIEGYVQ